ncbi:CRISPR-associated helicase Cas3', partial [Methanobrevibacter sp. UBA337]|uniref:CRISPR-associated helicase Cas3' n=1 Tax=Methanobrevibacter sp. UBA337 TaxID=1915480 RepID=UPI0039B96845
MSNEIFAKPDETLIQHTENTLKVFKSIKDAYPEVPKLCGVNDFWEHLFYSIFFHDFGKAAIGFQESLTEKGPPWRYRHEILSASFISSLNNFYPNFYKYSIGLAIITHHKDINYLKGHKYSTFVRKGVPTEGLRVYNEKLNELKPNFNTLIKYFSYVHDWSFKYLGYTIKTPKTIKFEELEDVFKPTVLKYKNEYKYRTYTQLHGVYGVFLKGFVNACDYLASGSKYEILNGIKDIGSLFDFKTLRKTQILASKTKGDTFLTAPTGSGKTEAALLWSGNNQNPLASKRVFYLLPYTASINAMYTRLKKDFKNPDLVANLHGKASYFLYKTFSDLDYQESKDKVKEIQNLSKKIYRPYKVLTPFQIIKSFFGVKGFEMNLSELANSLIILDEIHAYDAHVTSLLLEVLKILKKDYNVNFFIMSATIPSFLKKIFIKELNINQEILLN